MNLLRQAGRSLPKCLPLALAAAFVAGIPSAGLAQTKVPPRTKAQVAVDKAAEANVKLKEAEALRKFTLCWRPPITITMGIAPKP